MLNKKVLLAFGVLLVFLTSIFLLMLLSEPRTSSKFSDSLLNLRDIGLPLKEYTEDNDNKFPDKFEQLDDFDTNPEIFESPLKPKNFNGPSYVYIAGHSPIDKKSIAEKYIIAYENSEYCAGYSNETNIPFIALFLDGTAKRMKKDKFLSSLEATYEHLDKPMP